MSSKIPKSRPKQTRDETAAILARYGIDPSQEIALLGVRGYYSTTFGKTGNDINVYDDALFVISPDTYKAYNFNTDPARSGKKLAMLSAGLYEFYKGKHKGKYNALRPYPEGVRLPCTRDGVKSLCGATNIHRGGQNDTWSEGCQTIPEPQFSEAMPLIYKQMTKYGQKTIKYALVDVSKVSAATSTATSVAANQTTTQTATSPATTPLESPPIEIERTVVETEGDTVTATTTTQSDTVSVTAPEPYMGVGFWGVIKRDLAAATGGNLSFTALSEYAQQASGWPEWVVGIITKLAIGALIVTFGYFIFRVIHYAVDSWKKNEKTKTEAAANTSKDRFNIEWS